MERDNLESHLRRATRNFTARLPEEQVFSLGLELARELARAHNESPPRYPDLEPGLVHMLEGRPRLEGGASIGDASEDLFQLGVLLNSLAGSVPAEVAWRLDGPPVPEVSTVARRAALLALASLRREARFGNAQAAVEALETALAPPSASGAFPWPLFRGDAARTGARPASRPFGTAAPLWESSLGPVVASPALTPTLALVPTSDGRLFFLDRNGGRVLHEMRLASGIESSPALAGSLLHVGTDDGEVVGVDLTAGKERYRTKLGQMVRSSPLVQGDRIVVGVVEMKEAGGLVALDSTTGKIVWKQKVGAVFSSPALAGDRVLVGSDDGSLHAFDASKGARLWSCRLGGKVRATPTVLQDLALVADFEGHVAAVRLTDGTTAWIRGLGHPVYSSACVVDDVCIFGCHEGDIHAVSVSTGAEVFRVRTGGPVVSSPVAAGAGVLAASTDGTLYVLDPGGQVTARVPLSKSGIQSSPALDFEVAYIGSGQGLHALRLAQ